MNLRSVGRPSFGLAMLGALAAALGFVTYAALGSVSAEEFPLQPAGLTVALGAGALALLVPLALSTGITRAIRGRGANMHGATVAAGTVVACNLAGIVAIQVSSPVTVKNLWTERGTWVVDASRGVGPYGPPALPVVARRLEELQAAKRLDEAAPLWCAETSAGFAVGLASGLREGVPLTIADALSAVLARHQIGQSTAAQSAEGAAPAEGAPAQPAPLDASAIPEGVDGRALLSDVMDLARAAGPSVDLPPAAPPDGTPASISRKRIAATTPGWEARYEDGAWRWCPGTAADAVIRGHAHAIAIRAEAERVPTPTIAASAGPHDKDVRIALKAAILGRSAWLAGAAPQAAEWTASLTQPSAAFQGERMRAWCTSASKDDAARSAALGSVTQRWTLPAPGTAVDPAVRALLEAQGRHYLNDVLSACAPVLGDRQVQDAARGLDIPEAQRLRWAELEAKAIASSAALKDDGAGGVTISFEGGTARAAQEEGVWRIDLR